VIELDIEKRFAARGAQAGARPDATEEARPQAVTAIQATLRSDARVLALFGRSGSGKSTVINIIAGLARADRAAWHGRIAGAWWWMAKPGLTASGASTCQSSVAAWVMCFRTGCCFRI